MREREKRERLMEGEEWVEFVFFSQSSRPRCLCEPSELNCSELNGCQLPQGKILGLLRYGTGTPYMVVQPGWENMKSLMCLTNDDRMVLLKGSAHIKHFFSLCFCLPCYLIRLCLKKLIKFFLNDSQYLWVISCWSSGHGYTCLT